MCHDMHTKFHKDSFIHSKVDKGDTQRKKYRHPDRMMIAQDNFYFLKIKGVI
jgi:hypothetical protein